MVYVDGCVIPVPIENKEAYRKRAIQMSAVLKEHGALSVVDCWGDDVPEGKITSMPMAVKCQDDETVIFSWITWPSKEIRDTAWAKVMEDPRMNHEENPMPFDGSRMIFGGFQMIVNE